MMFKYIIWIFQILNIFNVAVNLYVYVIIYMDIM